MILKLIFEVRFPKRSYAEVARPKNWEEASGTTDSSSSYEPHTPTKKQRVVQPPVMINNVEISSNSDDTSYEKKRKNKIRRNQMVLNKTFANDSNSSEEVTSSPSKSKV